MKESIINRDPIEKTLRFKLVERKVDRMVRKEIGEGGYRGYCHKFWGTKKRILRGRYGIDWKSPDEMNPNIKFD